MTKQAPSTHKLKQIDVAVGVVFKDNLFFVCRRENHKHQGGKWEFPGGKIEPGESPEQALARELKEEISIVVEQCKALPNITFTYPEVRVSLHVYLVDKFSGNAIGAEGQEAKWCDISTLQTLDFPDANKQIIETLVKSF